MFSQYGTDINGDPVKIADGYKSFADGEFIPNLSLDLLNRKLECNNANIRGNIESHSGTIGGLKIADNALLSNSMEFSETNIEPLSSLKNPGTVTINRISSWTNEIDGVSRTQEFTIEMSFVVKFRVVGYLYFSSDNGLEAMFGNYGLILSSSGLQKTINGGTS